MRFKTYVPRELHHFVSCVGWINTEEVLSCGDDHQILLWNVLTRETTKITNLPQDLFPTDLHCYPKFSKQKTSDLLVVGASDGKYYFISRNGKTDKIVDAHSGAVLSVKWSHDGSALATSGEDGLVKIWSKSGMLRSTLSASSVPTYCIAWSPKSDQIIYTSDIRLVIKPLTPNSKPIEWKAHEGVILKVCWNINNNMIISGSEDCRYKIWDSMGRILFASALHEFPITSIAWSPDGSLFAVGSFNTLKLCDKSGWSYSLDKPQIQSIFSLCWSSDSTQIAGACANGNVIFAHVIDKRIEWKWFEINIVARKTIQVKNVTTGVEDELDFKDFVIKISIQFGYFIVITTSQCFIYKTTNFTTPHHFDLKETNVSLLLQSDKHFLLIDFANVTLYSYEGRLLINIKWIGMKIEALNKDTISLSCETIAVRDANDRKIIQFIDTANGKLINDGNNSLKHKLDIISVSLDNCGPSAERICVFMDTNFDVYLTLVQSSNASLFRTIKLASMVKCYIWCEDANILATIQENNKLNVWIYPLVAFVDNSLITMAAIEKDATEFGTKNPQMVTFLNNRLSIRRSDGSLISCSINPFATILHNYSSQMRWNEALKLCQFLKENYDIRPLWATLAGMALHARQLHIAEMAYSAINKVDKVLYIQKIKSLKDSDARNAEIALICGNIRECETILLHSGFLLRAIVLNLELFKWERALELANHYENSESNYVELVLAYRQRYLDRAGKSENIKAYKQQLNEIEFSEWQVYQERINNAYEERSNIKMKSTISKK